MNEENTKAALIEPVLRSRGRVTTPRALQLCHIVTVEGREFH